VCDASLVVSEAEAMTTGHITGGPTIRRLRLLVRLYQQSRQPVRAIQYARDEGVVRRTVYNDLEVLQAAGFPVYNTNEGWTVLDTPLPKRLRTALGIE